MKRYGIISIKKYKFKLVFLVLFLLLATLLHLIIEIRNSPANTPLNPSNRTIVIDPGHGGIDGGTSSAGILEKDINLSISRLLKARLEEKGYNVILTREKDVSLDSLCNTGGSRHHKDLKARTAIINQSSAQLFMSIHVNSNFNNPRADGSIVFYDERLPQARMLAYCIQRPLNKIVFENNPRTVRDPQKAEYFILKNTDIPGIIIETGFISNADERTLLSREEFRNVIAVTISDGIDSYYEELNFEAKKAGK